MTRRSSLVVAAAVACAMLVGSREARACGRGGYGLEGLAYVAAVGAVMAGTLVAVDTTYTIYDSAHASPNHPPSTGWAGAERYVATPQVVIGALVGLGVVADEPEGFPIALAWTAWPAALAAHGFYTHDAVPYGDGWKTPVVVLGVVDGGLAVYDVGKMIAGERPLTSYAIGELVGAAPQTLFGLAYAAQTGGRDARTALLLTALPAALMIHAIVELALPEPPPPPPPPPANAAGPLHAMMPTFVVQGALAPAPGLGLVGAF